jgi:hypothetical protein
MRIEEIKVLTMNPHFYSFMIENFLSGYGKECEIEKVFYALPLLVYSESREKLSRANIKSIIETVYASKRNPNDQKYPSERVRLIGYKDRYDILVPYVKKSLIILYSKESIVVDNKNIKLLRLKKFNQYKGSIRQYAKAAHYLGVIFAKTDLKNLKNYLGVKS